MINWVKHITSVALICLSISIIILLSANLRVAHRTEQVVKETSVLTAQCSPVRSEVVQSSETTAHLVTIFTCQGTVKPKP